MSEEEEEEEVEEQQRPSSKVDANPPSCRCAEKQPQAVVSGASVRVAPSPAGVSGVNGKVAATATDG